MEKSIFHISQEYIALSEALIEAGGEISPELERALTLNKEELEVKGSNYGFIVKKLQGDLVIIESEIERLSKLKEYRKNAIDRLKATLSGAMKLHGIEEIKTPLIKINFRSSESVEIDDLKLVDKKFLIIKESCSADKIRIKEAIKAGEAVVGAVLKENQNLQIK